MKKYSVIDALDHIDETIELIGWADTVRDHKKVVFIDLRDRTGKIQVVGNDSFHGIQTEALLKITGTIVKRPERLINPNMETGTVEMQATSYELIAQTEVPPLPLGTDGLDIDPEVRLRYRYLDLRRPRMNRMIQLRSEYSHALRQGLYKRGFTEVETPILTKSTKEGSRDFLVPSRLNPGHFYALPQSPQQYKQLLMVAGVERYFQFARCVRDEDLRADRGFEHTQLDMEMSFMTQQEIMHEIKTLLVQAIKAVGGKLQTEEFPIITYDDAMSKYGADKFDLRSEAEKEDGTLAFAWVVNFPFFKQVDAKDAAEVVDGKSGWTFTHNPFSIPTPESMKDHMAGTNIESIRTSQYDLVCNGYEAGGGSVRAHLPEILEATYRIMGYSKQETQDSIGHMLEAFSFATPPHGGIGMGLDRHMMLLSGQSALSETQAFPMTSSGKTAVMDAPNTVDDAQLKELGIKVV